MDCCFDLPIVLCNAPDSHTAQHDLLVSGPSDELAPPVGRRAAGLSEGRAGRAYEMHHGVTLLDFLQFCVDECQTRVLEMSWKAPSLRILPALPGLRITIAMPMNLLLSQAVDRQQALAVPERPRAFAMAAADVPGYPCSLTERH